MWGHGLSRNERPACSKAFESDLGHRESFLAERIGRTAHLLRSVTAAICALGYLGCSGSDVLAPLAPPTLTAITPAVGVQGTSLAVTVTGKNFVGGASGFVVGG